MAKFISFIALLLLVSPLCFGQEKDDDESGGPEQSELAEIIKLLQPTAQPQPQPQQQPGKQQKPPQKFPQQPKQPQQQYQQQQWSQQQQLPWLSNWAQRKQQWQQFFKQWPEAWKRFNYLQQLWNSRRGAQQGTGQQKGQSAQDLLYRLILQDNA